MQWKAPLRSKPCSVPGFEPWDPCPSSDQIRVARDTVNFQNFKHSGKKHWVSSSILGFFILKSILFSLSFVYSSQAFLFPLLTPFSVVLLLRAFRKFKTK